MTSTTLTRWKIVGWMPALGCTVAVGIGLLISLSPGPASSIFPFSYRVVDTIVPLFFGLQAAFLLSPETEPSLEILLSSQFPLSKVLWERFFILALFGGTVALSGNLIQALFSPQSQSIVWALMRWIPACVFLGGTAIFTTFLTRQGIFGALLALLMWGGMLMGMDALLTRFPFLWPIHVYLQPGQESLPKYLVNRLSLTGIGLALIFLAAHLAENEERMLGLSGGKT